MRTRPVEPRDAAAWEHLRQALWPDAPGAHARIIAAFFAGQRLNPVEALLALDARGRPVGLVELSLRNYAEGCAPGRVAYVEGWYVVPESRRGGVGAALIAAAEAWARARGCGELGSDAAPDNAASLAAHRALGFEEVARSVAFRKFLPSEPPPTA